MVEAIRSGDIFDRDINLIDPDPDNPRDVTSPVAITDIEEIAHSILTRGFDLDRAILVRKKPDGRWMVTDGHKRRIAFLRAIELGASLRGIPCRSERVGTDNEDRAIFRLRAPGREFSPLEASVDIKRLLAWGWTEKAITEKLGKQKDPGWVKRCLELAGAEPEVRQAVRDDKIAPTEALRVIRKHGANAGPVIEAAAKQARSEGRERVRPRDVNAVTKPRTEPVSLCSLAMAVVKAWEDSSDTLDFQMAMEALKRHLGPLAKAA